MSFMKSLFVVRNVRTILILASVFGIIFLSCAIIDKDSSIAQAQENYMIKSYIKIDGSIITRNVRVQKDKNNNVREFNVRDALNLRRKGGKADGDFTLIEINVGGRSLYILASDVCVCKDPQNPIEQNYKTPYAQPGEAIGPQLEQMNQNLVDTGKSDFLYMDVPDSSCFLFNNRWI